MFRGDLEVAADMVLGEVLEIFGVSPGEVHPHAAGDEHPLHALDFPSLPHHLLDRAMIGAEQFADGRMDAGEPAAPGLDFRSGASHLIHVGRRAADVGDGSLETGLRGEQLDLADDRVFGAALDDPALVGRDRAEGTAAETAAHDLHARLHDLEGRDPGRTI